MQPPTTLVEAAVYLAMLCVLLGLYKGDKGWGRTLLWWSLLLLVVLLVRFRSELFPTVF